MQVRWGKIEVLVLVWCSGLAGSGGAGLGGQRRRAVVGASLLLWNWYKPVEVGACLATLVLGRFEAGLVD